ncbi:transporter [Sulfurovum sp.]|uniref:transporter n=1 Tax=Sulfurovum sp. TaxID=1969726 RepID=UPI0025D6D16A|nr:transporter [Sulfurovum sp.]
MKNRLLSATLASFGLISLTQNASAQVIPGLDTKAGGMVVPQGKAVIALKHIYFKRDSMFDSNDEVINKEHLDATANVTLLALRYGIAKNMDIRIVMPYKQISATAKLGINNVAIDNSGIGDIVMMGKYRFYNQYAYQLAVGAGVKFPTGSTNKGFKKAPPFAQGINTPLPTQPGTGKAEYKLEFGASKLFDPTLRADMHTMYTYRPKAENDYDFGNEFLFDIGVVKAITDKFNIGLEYNFKYNTATDMGNDTNPMLRSKLPFKAFSGSAGYITPEIEYLPFGKPKIFVGAGVSFLIHKDLKEYQPLEKRKFVVRMGYLF